MITVRLLNFRQDILVGSANTLDPTDVKSGRDRTQSPDGKRCPSAPGEVSPVQQQFLGAGPYANNLHLAADR